MELRVAIVGSHSTGKTTLLRALSPFLDVPVISEIAREKIAESETLPHEMTPMERGEFQRGILHEQIKRETATRAFLADRSIFDAASYAFDTPVFHELAKLAHDHAARSAYDRIFFLPIEFALVGDDIRSGDETYRKSVEDALVSVLESAGIGYETVRGRPEERISQCLSSLSLGGIQSTVCR